MSDRMPALPDAACRDPEVAGHFTTRIGGALAAARAAKVCDRCWDRPECLAWGLQHEDSGIWGGHGRNGLEALRKQFGIPYKIVATAGWAGVEWTPRGTAS